MLYFPFVLVVLFGLYGFTYYPIGLLLFKLGLRRIGLRLIAMSFFYKRCPKYCSFDCSTYNCRNWTCPNYSKSVGDK